MLPVPALQAIMATMLMLVLMVFSLFGLWFAVQDLSFRRRLCCICCRRIVITESYLHISIVMSMFNSLELLRNGYQVWMTIWFFPVMFFWSGVLRGFLIIFVLHSCGRVLVLLITVLTLFRFWTWCDFCSSFVQVKTNTTTLLQFFLIRRSDICPILELFVPRETDGY